jgi:pentose-5-phosphate-3-epimerase/CBS domain-containing protein
MLYLWPMKLSASLYASKTDSPLNLVGQLDDFGVDFWHVDSIENLDVFADIQAIHNISTTPVDLHIITKKPENFLQQIEQQKPSRVSFQIEELPSGFEFPKFSETKVGLAIQISNPNLIKLIADYESQIDFVLLMMTTPGVSGGRFEDTFFQIIRQLMQKFPAIAWTVDGGVTHEITYILRLLGVQTIVVGSYLTGHQNMAKAILDMHSRKVNSQFKVVDYAIPAEELPVVLASSSVLEMLEKMQNYKLGIVFVVDALRSFVGVITNADIRNVLISKQFAYNQGLEKFINRSPVFIYHDSTTETMIKLLDDTNFPILVLPIVSPKNELIGAISFHKLLSED